MTEGLAPAPQAGPARILPGQRPVLAWLLPLLSAAAAAAIAGRDLGGPPLTAGEASQITLARRSFGDVWETAHRSDLAHLATSVAWKPWLWLFGSSSEAVVRIPALVAVSLAAGLVVVLGCHLFGRVAGATAGGVLATSSLVLDAGSKVGAAPFALFFTVAALGAVVLASETDSRLRWALAAILGVVAMLFALSFATVILAVPALLAARGPRRWLRPAVTGGVFVVAILVYLIALNHTRAWNLDWLASPTLDSIRHELWVAAGRTPVPAAVAAIGLVTTALRWTRGGGVSRAAFLLLWAVAPVAGTLLVSLWRPAFSAGYLVPTLPALALLAGAAVGAVGWRGARPAVLPAAALVVAGSALSVVQWLRDEPVANWRAAARFVSANDTPTDTVLVAPGRSTAAFLYYTPGAQVRGATQNDTLWVVAAGPTRARQLLIGRAAARAPAYVLVSRREFGRELMVQRWVRAASDAVGGDGPDSPP